MSNYFEKLKKLVELLGDEEEREQYLFNPLEEFHANENAHTRVLVALLKIPFVCRSFLQYLHKKFPSADEWFNGCEAEPTKVSCLSDYVDAAITVGRKTAIIENKINGAEDQDSQIDRYVTAKASASRKEDILVFYLTLDGSKEVSACSFDKSKNILEYQGPESPGRFLTINYKDHILDWLKNSLLFPINTFSKQPVLYSGIVQYIDYLEGEQCLALRTANDGCKKFCDKILKQLERNGLDSAVSLLTEYERRKALFRVETLDYAKSGQTGPKWNEYPNDEKALALRSAFCEAFMLAKPDNEFYVQIPQSDNFTNATIALNRWVDTSLVQIDFWFDGDGNHEEYVKQYDEYLRKLKEIKGVSYIPYKYNNASCIRCAIDDPCQLKSVIEIIGGSFSSSRNDSSNEGFTEDAPVANWIRLETPLAKTVRYLAQKDDSGDRLKWEKVMTDKGGIIDYTYHYVNGWAIQLSENFTSEMPIRAIEFFPARQTDARPVVKRLAEKRHEHPFRCYRWDGRTVFQYPVATKEEAKAICSFLHSLRKGP